MYTANGIKAWLIVLGVLLLIIVILVAIFHAFVFLLPLIIIFVVISYLFRILNKLKKRESHFIDIKHKIKK